MPAVVAGHVLVAHGLGLVDAEYHVRHERHLPCWVAAVWCCRSRPYQRTVGSGHAHQARPGQQPTLARGGRAARWWERPAYALDAPLIAVRARRWWIGAGFLLGAHREARRARGPATGRSTRRLGGALGSGKAREGGTRRSRTSWAAARGHPVDHLRVVAACLLTRQHRGNGLGCPVGHRHGEDPPGVPTAARAHHGRHGRAHRHPLLKTAAVTAAIVVDGH